MISNLSKTKISQKLITAKARWKVGVGRLVAFWDAVCFLRDSRAAAVLAASIVSGLQELQEVTPFFHEI